MKRIARKSSMTWHTDLSDARAEMSGLVISRHLDQDDQAQVGKDQELKVLREMNAFTRFWPDFSDS